MATRICSNSVIDWFGVEERASGVNGFTPGAGPSDADPDWQPL